MNTRYEGVHLVHGLSAMRLGCVVHGAFFLFMPSKKWKLRTYTVRPSCFQAGMNGKPIGGSQFNHVAFFSGEVNLGVLRI
jgi:hypothetical protein